MPVYSFRTSILKTPQAVNDTAVLSEDDWVLIDVMANDLGGAAKTLWSLNQSDLTSQSLSGALIALASGSTIWIENGAVGYDAGSLFQNLESGQIGTDYFQYSIRLADGTYSIARVDVTIIGADDGPVLPSFSRTDIACGHGPQYVTVADVNNDGYDDVIAALNYGGAISIMLNDKHGGFLPHQEIAGVRPHDMEVVDLNGDGKLDIVTSTDHPSSLAVFLGDGAGAFSPAGTMALAADPNAFVAADFDGDGKIDIIAGSVELLLGNGDGTFHAPTSLNFGTNIVDIATADFNNDGKADVVFADAGNNSVSIRHGNGDGTFAPAATYGVSTSPGRIAIADLNHDGKLDFTVGSIVFVAGSNDTFTFTDYGVDSAAASTIADFNGDGILDVGVVSAIPYVSSATVLIGNGDGTFGSATEFDVGEYSFGIASGDFDRNGLADFVVTNSGDDTISLFSNALIV